jgi:hypothetical protein
VLVSEAALVKIKEILLERGQVAIYMGRRIFMKIAVTDMITIRNEGADNR